MSQQQVVEIAKALAAQRADHRHGRTHRGTVAAGDRALFAIIRELQAQGIGVIYISHRLSEVFEIADRVMVLRDGAHVGTRPIARTDPRVGSSR